MLAGLRGLADGGWGNSVVADALPAHLPNIDAPTFNRRPAKAILTAESEESLLTRLDSDRDTNVLLWKEMPDIADFQYLAELKPGAVTLLEVDIQGTTHPLLVHQRFGRGNTYILAAEQGPVEIGQPHSVPLAPVFVDGAAFVFAERPPCLFVPLL